MVIPKLYEWANSLNEANLNMIAQCYHEDALFLGALDSNQIGVREGPQIKKYFESFLKLKPYVDIVSHSEVKLGDNSIMCAGYYNFNTRQSPSIDIAGYRGATDTTMPPSLNSKIIHAKFTFIFKLKQEGWKILHHNSGLCP